jgi:hypothetical protein
MEGKPNRDYDFVEFEDIVHTDKIKDINKYIVSVSVQKHLYDIILNNNIIMDYINNNNIALNIY